IKDVASIKGVRDNQLVGYGLVVGLTGTGDKKGANVQSLMNMLYRYGITIAQKDVNSKNVAAVMVTAALPPFPKVGRKIDAVVSAIGDSKNLQGGTLLMTPLKGADDKVYAVAQGAVSIGGFSTGTTGGGKVTKNFTTVGRVPEGVTIEKEFGFDLSNAPDISIILNRTDFTTASNISKAINRYLQGDYAKAYDPSSVKVNVPEHYKGNVVGLINNIESLEVAVDVPAKVVINERTGTVVIGENVKLSPVAISHGDLTIEVTQPSAVEVAPLAGGGTAPEAAVTATEKKIALTSVSGATLAEIVDGLNKLGVSPRDLIAILQSLKAAGSLRAELEIM
ncbi:MAG: flagellar basal body P-ring protein FlgI, partial [Nitrospirae bacterium]|nr:flagellar basal body P-ring protein FlgI [Nitrospirota bacterium]